MANTTCICNEENLRMEKHKVKHIACNLQTSYNSFISKIFNLLFHSLFLMVVSSVYLTVLKMNNKRAHILRQSYYYLQNRHRFSIYHVRIPS
jgi:hypothetical protein